MFISLIWCLHNYKNCCHNNNMSAPQLSTPQEFDFSLPTVLLIMGIGLFTTGVSEFVSWLMMYRKEDYKLTSSEIEKLNKKLEKLKNTHVIQAQNKSHEKKIHTVEDQLKKTGQQMMFNSMKCNVIIGVMMIAMLNLVGTHFQGQVVAKLPFEPFGIIQGITHRGLEGNDFTESAYLFIYILSTFVLRNNIKKIFGFEAPKPAVSYFQPPKQE